MGGGNVGNRVSYAVKREGGKEAYSQDVGNSLNSYSEGGKPRVFLSFHIEDEFTVNLMRMQATDGRLEFTDYSVKEPFDEKWKTQCTERLRRSSMLVVMIGAETHKREAVDWEIRKAIELGKPVMGVRIHRDKNHVVPPALKEVGAKIIYWNLDDIQKEVDKLR